MSKYWSNLVNGLTPYVPGEQPADTSIVKLNTNENPYGPSPMVAAALAETDSSALRLYPDPQSTALRKAFAERHQLDEQQVFIGNGSDEVLALTFMGLLKHELPLYFPDITYSFYPVWADLCGIECRTVSLGQDLVVDPAAFPLSNGGIILPNPNAPTGHCLKLRQIEEMLRRNTESVVVIDEAYIDFGGESAVSLVDRYPNLLVVQTLSKARSLAGLRVGVAFGQEHLIEALDRVKNSFNSYPLDTLAQRLALAALGDEAYFRQCCDRIIASRETLTAALQELGFNVLPSKANFVFAAHATWPARELFARLRDKGILVRYFDKPRIDNYLRVTVGTDEQCEALLRALEDILGD